MPRVVQMSGPDAVEVAQAPLEFALSPAVARAVQLPPNDPLVDSAAVLGRVLQMLHPEDKASFRRNLDWASAGGHRTKLVLRLARAGDWVTVFATLEGTGTNTVRVSIELDDAAAAKRAERQLRQIVEGAQQAAVVRLGRRVVYTNRALATMLGYASLEEMREKGADREHTHPDDQEMVDSRVDARIAGRDAPDNYEFRMVRIDGRVIWIECFASLITWNGEPAVLAWLLDISERKRQLEALRQSETLFEAVFQSSPAMLVLGRMDDGRIFDVNDSWLRFFGLDRQAAIGRTERELKLFAPETPWRECLGQLLAAPSGREILANVRTAKGEMKEIALSARTLRFAERDMLLNVARDVTDRRREIEELRQSKTAAEMANRSKSEFLANMSHELRTPLNAIIGFSEIIAGELFGPIRIRRYAEYAADIHDSGRHLLQIINDLLDLSKLEAGKQELREVRLSLERVASDSIRLVRERAVSAGLQVGLAIEPGIPDLWADERMVKQILVNLLTNAIKFTESGGQVTVAAARGLSGALELTVSDTGIGMSEAEISTALAAFGQIDNALTRKHQGTGLGLPIVQALVELHGGSIEIRSQPGIGTAIIAKFPAARTMKQKAPCRELAAE